MRAVGLVLEGGLAVGSSKTLLVRVRDDREKRGWYRLSEIEIGGEYYLVGAYGIWHGNVNGKVAVKPGPKVAMSREQRDAINARIRSDQAKRKPPPAEPPSLNTMVRMVATHGGFLNRKHDGFPGPNTLWIGLQRIPDFVLALEAQRSVGESCG